MTRGLEVGSGKLNPRNYHIILHSSHLSKLKHPSITRFCMFLFTPQHCQFHKQSWTSAWQLSRSKIVPVHAMNVYWDNRGTAPLIQLGIRRSGRIHIPYGGQ
jgi:hypothetical protein